MNKTVKDFERDLEIIQKTIEELKRAIDDKAQSAAKLIVTEKCHEMSDTLDHRIESRLRTALLFVGGMLTILGILGYFGLQSYVPAAVREAVGDKARQQIEQIRNQAQQDLASVEKAKSATEKNPLIVLQTDYGSKGPYMGTLMGVIYHENPSARIQVVTAEIDDFDVLHAAWTLWRASRFYPPGTIFVVITNPGGITTLPTVLKTQNGFLFIGHDNGCLDLVAQAYGVAEAHTVLSSEIGPSKFRDLFGGVDLFGPLAAKLSLGLELDRVGPKQTSYTSKLPKLRHVIDKTVIRGSAMDVDRYGNVTTNISEDDLESSGIRVGQELHLLLNGKAVQMPFRATYGHVSEGQPVAILYEGLLQLAVNQASFATKFHLKRGDLVELER